jgi:hypothetical protein
MASDGAQDIGWIMACDGLKRWDCVCHLMARRDWLEYGLERWDRAWHMIVRRDWMEYGTYWPEEIGWNMACIGLKRLEGV